jgi:chromosome segregation ATPase
MSELQQHISNIKDKLQVLQKQMLLHKKENDRLTATLQQIQGREEKVQQELEKAQQQNLILKASLNNLEPADKKELLKKINSYLKSIDSCISLMSK